MQKLYFGGSIITMENHIQPQAVLTSDGFITGVGDFSALDISAPNAEKIDLKGATMLPSFMDAHSHFSSYATSFLQASLEESVSFEEIGKRVQKFIADNKIPKGEWVNARGYDHNMLVEKRHPDLTFLDACAPDNPLILQHASGHVGVFNSMALKNLGITCDTPSPAGGKIGHEGGKLNGYMEENAFITYLKKVPMADIKDMVSAFEKAQNGYASRGITTIQEGMTVAQLIPLYQMLLGMDALKLDVVAYADMKDAKTLFSTFPDSVQKYDKHLKLGGYKIFLDGSPQGRTAWLRQPYEGEKEYCGYGTMEDEQVKKAIETAAENHMQILAHCNGDAAAQQYIDAIQAVSEGAEVSKVRPVMIHSQLLAKDQLPQVKALGIIPSFFIAHVFHWGDIHIENFGIERAKSISLAASALKQGILFTFHQDTPVIEPDMLQTVWCAVNRLTKGGVVLGQEEKIPVYEALKAVTINSAYQYFEEDTKGSIKVGKYADFVILDKNPLTVEPMDIKDIKVLATIKNDKVLFQR